MSMFIAVLAYLRQDAVPGRCARCQHSIRTDPSPPWAASSGRSRSRRSLARQTTRPGEHAVPPNRPDRTLSVIPIGLSKVVRTVPLDIAPHDVATAPNSDRACVTGASTSGEPIALASLDAKKQVGNLDPGSRPDEVAS